MARLVGAGRPVTSWSFQRWMPALIFLVCWGLTTHGKYSVTGDEPHYLMVVQSLWADHDLDVRNNYDEGQGARFGASGLQPELHARPARDGRFLPVHDVGLPFVLLPAYVVATTVAALPPERTLAKFRMNRGLFAYSLISLFVIAIVAWAAGATASALVRWGVAPRAALTIVVAAWLTAPVLSNSFLVFPEPFALLLTAWMLLACASRADEWTWRDSMLVLALGALPWLHRKYALYALALLVVLLWRKRRAVAASGRAALVRDLALFAAPQVALAAWTYHYWGNLAGPLTLDRLPFSLGAFKDGAAGILFDRENGLVWWAPVYALLPAAWWLRRSDAAIWLLPIAALMIPSAAHDQWWGGFSPAARFLVPVIPILCLVGAILIRQAKTAWFAAALMVPQALIAAYGWQHPRFLWPQGDGHNRILSALLGAAGLHEDWIPSFRTSSSHAWMAAVVLALAILALNAVVVVVARRSARGRSRHEPA